MSTPNIPQNGEEQNGENHSPTSQTTQSHSPAEDLLDQLHADALEAVEKTREEIRDEAKRNRPPTSWIGN